MFSNLPQGSILYGLDTKGGITLFTAPITSVSVPRLKQLNNTFGQIPEYVVDIVAIINGEKREFKQVPSNLTVADFGEESYVLADSRESLNSYVMSMLQNSENIVNSVDKHTARIKQYKKVLAELNPQYVNHDDGVVKELKEQVDTLQKQLAEAISLIKSGNNNK